MPIARRIKAALAATTLLLGCQAAPPSVRPITALAPEVTAGVPRSTQLRMVLREKDVREVLEKRYGLQQFQQIDWDMVRVWLSNSRAGFVTRMEKASPTLDLNTNTRAASLLFDNLTPGGNYSVVLYLYRNGDQNQFDTEEASDPIHLPPELIASGTNTDFTIRSGQNNINVVVRLIENGGELVVDVEDPATPAIQTIAAQFNLTTYSHFLNDANFGDIDAETGGEIGGIAALMDGTGDVIFTVAGAQHQIRKYDGGSATGTTLLAGTGSQTNANYTNAGDYWGSLDGTLNGPRGLVVGQNGEMLFADTGNARIRALRQDTDASGSLYRLETLIGSGPITLSESGNSTEPIDVALVRPVGIVADDNGTIFFADDDATNSRINIYRYEMSATDNAIATLTFIDRLTRTNSTASSYFGTMAINRLRDLLWVVTGDNQVRAITGIYGSPSDVAVANFSGSEWFPATRTIRAITFDQLEGRVNNNPAASNTRWGTLYVAAHEGTDNTIIYRVPVQTNGTLPTGRIAEPIAGGNVGASATAIATDHARAMNFTIGWNALTFNLDENNDGGGDPLNQLFVGDVNGDLYRLEQFLVDDNNNWVTQASNAIFYPTPDPSPN